MVRGFLSRRWWMAAILAVALAGAAHPLWMSALGGFLVKADDPFHADLALVLGGDHSGQRIRKAADLVRQGYTRSVLVSGPGSIYGQNEADLAIRFAALRGDPESWFVALRISTNSTREEARAIAPALRRLGAKRVILVTSNYHTRRAGGLFREADPGLDFRVVAADDKFFPPARWWQSREAQKIFVMEWLKTVTGWFGV